MPDCPPDDIVVQDPPKGWRSLYLWNGGNGLPMLFVTGTDSTYFSLILLQLATTRCPELRSIARIHRPTPLSAGIAISRQITRVFWLKPFSPFLWQPFHHLATPLPPRFYSFVLFTSVSLRVCILFQRGPNWSSKGRDQLFWSAFSSKLSSWRR